MERFSRTNLIRQRASFRFLLEEGYIRNLRFKKKMRNGLKVTFQLDEVRFQYNDKIVEVDLGKYHFKVELFKNQPPKVFLEQMIFLPKTPHLHHDKSLCLYKPTNWQWHSDAEFHTDLFADCCLWLYFYEVWQQTGKWLGEEARHDMPAHVVNNFFNRYANYRNTISA